MVVPWVRDEQRAAFLRRWSIREPVPDWLVLQHDEAREGCGATKNKGISEALERGAGMVVVLDDDCFPAHEGVNSMFSLIAEHRAALEPQSVELFEVVTSPPSRGTPYAEHSAPMPVAASMGFWTEVGDYCAARQLVFGSGPMEFKRKAVYGRYFPLCGMNLAFRPREWMPWCAFIEVPRFDDIWMGWLWQREAYRRGCCFNLAGPLIRHSRQSSVWRNLDQEAAYLEASEVLWREIALSEDSDYDSLRRLLPGRFGAVGDEESHRPA